MRYTFLLAFILSLAGCSDVASPVAPTLPTPGAPPAESGQCAFQAESITVATTWVDTSSACDYEVTGTLNVSNGQLTIEPGVVVRFGQDASIWFQDGGSLYAVGTPQQRITFEGASAVRGFGKGLYFRSGSYESRIEYADLRYLGKLGEVVISERLQNGAISGFLGGELTLKNTTVMGSNHFGAELDRRSLILKEFANNRFYDNGDAGVVVSPESVGKLDAASDYLGGAQPNAVPYILVFNQDDDLSGTVLWPYVGVPYGVQYLYLEGGEHVVQPGVEFVFGEEGNFDLDYGTLTAIGTPQQPIIFRGLQATPGWWEDIYLDGSAARFEHVEVRHGGFNDLYSDRSITVNDSSFQIDNSVVADGSGAGIVCIFGGDVVVGAGTRFENLADVPYGIADSCKSFVAP